ncbi:MAG TPA: glycerol-3-phosphate dehydrogenase [Rhodospirillaceae bacterium]|nr:glycerol-3-phosphate dehydrogenase [Rhodospirillaceae bacterium]|tara:strand:- start:898 stop:2409 length:1512 start_codon:yes stop_codon:yes gene_type:complete
MYDVLVIGGGINGAGIARDAAGRGLSVLLVEQGDLAQATSSASTKLIHGGLRYLEQYDFKLVAEALAERERLLKSASHIIWPLKFVIPHEPHLRPRWMIRAGLWLYDMLGGRRTILPSSRAFKLTNGKYGAPLQGRHRYGFCYADCWVDDARLVVTNALDALAKGAVIKTRTACTQLSAHEHEDKWRASLKDMNTGAETTIEARTVINAAGPWVRRLLDHNDLAHEKTYDLRLSKGSHIIVPRLYEGDHAYLLQQPDGRIVFTIPYEHNYTMIGTTDVDYQGDPNAAQINDDEIDYLCEAASRSLNASVKPADIIHTFSGVRGLLDSGDDNLSEVTRDYKLDLDTSRGVGILNIFGGKITTYRKLAEHAVNKIAPLLDNKHGPWTKGATMAGGDIAGADFIGFFDRLSDQYDWLDVKVLYRLARQYGSRINRILGDAQGVRDLGTHFGDHVYEAEIKYLVDFEWAQTAEDILWRRTKLLLHTSPETQKAIADYLSKRNEEAAA